MHNPILAALAVIAMVVPANAEDFFKSHRIYKMLKGQAKPTPKRALDKFTNQVQRPTGALPWERNTDSSRRVSGVRYSVCVQREYLARKLAV